MTDEELEAERLALIAQDGQLEEDTQRLHLRPNDLEAHAAFRQRLQAHTERVRA